MAEPDNVSGTRVTAPAVQVWCASLNRWVDGFDLVSADDDGCIVRRRSDGEVLPLAFSGDQVRRPAAPARVARHRPPG
jgi:hypothetical protein